MRPEIKAQWLTALRNGDYQQGKGYLRKGDQYCCLGVLCDLYGKTTGSEWEAGRNACAGIQSMHGTETTLPFKVQKWAGIDISLPLELANRNDSGATFQELANLIERDL